MTSTAESYRQWSTTDKAALILSALVLLAGVVISIAISDWIALLAAAGLIVVPTALLSRTHRQGPRSS